MPRRQALPVEKAGTFLIEALQALPPRLTQSIIAAVEVGIEYLLTIFQQKAQQGWS